MGSLFSRKGFKKYFFNTNWLLADKLFKQAVSFLVGIYVARYLGPEKFGLLGYSIIVISLISPFWRLGLYPIINKEFIENPEREAQIFGTTVLAQVGMYFLAVIVVIAAAWGLSGFTPRERILLVIVLVGHFFSLSEVFEHYFNAKVRSKYVALAGIISVSVYAGSRVIFVLLELSLVYFAAAVVIESIVKAIFLLIFYLKNADESYKKWKFNGEVLKSLLSQSWPFILTGAMTGLYMKVDQVMIKHLLDDKAVGLYSVAVKLSEAWFLVPIVLTRSLFPAIINAKKVSLDLFRERMMSLYTLLIAIAITIAVIFWVYNEEIVKFIYGPDYLGAATVLGIYVWAIVFIFLNNAQWKWYIVMGYQNKAMLRIAIGLAINVSLNSVLIREYGIEGAAIATLITYFYVGYFGNLLSRDLRPNFILITKSFLFPSKRIATIFKGGELR